MAICLKIESIFNHRFFDFADYSQNSIEWFLDVNERGNYLLILMIVILFRTEGISYKLRKTENELFISYFSNA